MTALRTSPIRQQSTDAALTVAAATDADRDAWNAYVESTPAAEVYHRYEWRELLSEVFKHRCHYLMARDSAGSVVGVLPASEISSLLFGHFFVSIPYFNYGGALADSDAARHGLIEAVSGLARERGASHVELRHRGTLALDMPARTEKISMKLRLPATADELWDGFPSKLRSQIRRPQKAGAACAVGGLELLDDFFVVFSRNMRDLGTPVFPRSMFRKILELFPSRARVFVVTLEGRAAAAGFTIGYRDTLEIPFASSLREYSREAVNMLLYWSVLQHAVAEGYAVFDFGRTTTGSGPHRFKKQWGAEPEPLAWHYWLREGGDVPQLNPANPKFRLATQVWSKLPVGLTTFLGPKLVRYLA